MRERGIIFSGPMVRAILEGRKTQTRRVVKFKDYAEVDRQVHPHECPYGTPGDRLYVREAFALADYMLDGYERDDPCCVAYRADKTAVWIPNGNTLDTYAWNWDRLKWKPSIHMPKWASRIWLEVVGVRVERVNSISEEDVHAEGVDVPRCSRCGYSSLDCSIHWDHNLCGEDDPPTGVSAFQTLWDSINGKRPGCAWKDNPWVWVIEFKQEGRER